MRWCAACDPTEDDPVRYIWDDDAGLWVVEHPERVCEKHLTMPVERRGAVDVFGCPRRGRNRQRTTNCFCEPACAVCGFGLHAVLHGPEYGHPPGSRPWHHEYVPGEGRPVYGERNRYRYTDHPRQPWPDGPSVSAAQEPEAEALVQEFEDAVRLRTQAEIGRGGWFTVSDRAKAARSALLRALRSPARGPETQPHWVFTPEQLRLVRNALREKAFETSQRGDAEGAHAIEDLVRDALPDGAVLTVRSPDSAVQHQEETRRE